MFQSIFQYVRDNPYLWWTLIVIAAIIGGLALTRLVDFLLPMRRQTRQWIPINPQPSNPVTLTADQRVATEQTILPTPQYGLAIGVAIFLAFMVGMYVIAKGMEGMVPANAASPPASPGAATSVAATLPQKWKIVLNQSARVDATKKTKFKPYEDATTYQMNIDEPLLKAVDEYDNWKAELKVAIDTRSARDDFVVDKIHQITYVADKKTGMFQHYVVMFDGEYPAIPPSVPRQEYKKENFRLERPNFLDEDTMNNWLDDWSRYMSDRLGPRAGGSGIYVPRPLPFGPIPSRPPALPPI